MKKILIILAVVVVVVVAFIFFALSNLDKLIARAIETNGSEVTKTSVTVAGVEVSLRDGKGSIKGLDIASPEGFEAKKVFSLGDITLGIDVQSLRSETIVINEILISAPVVFAEVTKTGATNIDRLKKNVEEYMPEPSGEGEDQGGKEKLVLVRQFVFEKGRIEVDASALGLEKRTIDLPEIRLSDVGGPDGALPGEIAKIVLTAVARKAATQIGSSEINRLIEEKLGGELKDKAKGLLDKIKS